MIPWNTLWVGLACVEGHTLPVISSPGLTSDQQEPATEGRIDGMEARLVINKPMGVLARRLKASRPKGRTRSTGLKALVTLARTLPTLPHCIR
jgi:hypothetical protein